MYSFIIQWLDKPPSELERGVITFHNLMYIWLHADVLNVVPLYLIAVIQKDPMDMLPWFHQALDSEYVKCIQPKVFAYFL